MCDGGGSNSSRYYIFKADLQNLANEIGLEIRVAHYPLYRTHLVSQETANLRNKSRRKQRWILVVA